MPNNRTTLGLVADVELRTFFDRYARINANEPATRNIVEIARGVLDDNPKITLVLDGDIVVIAGTTLDGRRVDHRCDPVVSTVAHGCLVVASEIVRRANR